LPDGRQVDLNLGDGKARSAPGAWSRPDPFPREQGFLAMSLDTFVTTVMLLVALLLMTRFGCGSRMGHVDARKTSDSGRPGDAGASPTNKEQRK
jgi:hypothetical protein